MDTFRQFKCIKGCGAITPFDLRFIAKPNTNFVVCSHCGRKWMATVLPSCCVINIRFSCDSTNPGNTIVNIQSFNKVKG